MRNSRWLFELARTLAVVGALGISGATAWADESDSDQSKEDRTSQSRDEDRSERSSSRDEESESRSSRSSRDEDDSDSRNSSSEREQDRRQMERDDTDASDRSNRNHSERGQSQRDRSSRQSQQSRSSQDRDSQHSRSDQDRQRSNQQSSNREEDLGAEFETDDNNRLTVSSVEHDSIAGHARLQEDDVIISVDGRRFNDANQLTNYLNNAGGRRVPIIIERNGNRYTVQLQGSHQQQGWQQDSQQQYSRSNNQSGAWLGVYLDDNENGAEITQVYPQGPAARAGLRAGDVVVQFNGEDVTDSEELVSRIEEEQPNSRARFTVLRDEREMQVTATLADRNQFVARGQNTQQQYSQNQQYSQDQNWQQNRGQDQYSQDQYSQNQYRQNRTFQDQDRQYQGSQRNEYTDYNQAQRNDSRGYSSYNYPGQGQQIQGNRQGGDQIQRLERMVRELQDEVRDLRDRVDNR